ncbi:MAG: hypothetical protein OJJ54_13240 [Pseudonocardia sp.]|nr:hypothetical protein [Pseudonocardia sp.]
MLRTLSVPLAVAALVGAALLVPPFASTAGAGTPATAACSTPWGSTPESAPALSAAPVFDVRTGQHPCSDRVVIQVVGDVGGYTVRYVDVLTQEGSGKPLAVPGGARLSVTVNHPAHDDAGRATFDRPIGPVATVDGYPTLRSVVYGGSYEGYTQLGVGVRARLPFRVSTQAGPGIAANRIVIDIAHRWS